jgi:hypothetical protein
VQGLASQVSQCAVQEKAEATSYQVEAAKSVDPKMMVLIASSAPVGWQAALDGRVEQHMEIDER